MLNSRKHDIPAAQSKKSKQHIGHDEPVYLIRAKDKTSVDALRLIADNLYDDPALYQEVLEISDDFAAWQRQFPHCVSLPKV